MPVNQFAKWDQFVDASPQGDVFSYSWWLRAITKDNFKILAVFENNELVAGIPLAYYLGKINEPPLTRTLGPLFKDLSGIEEHDRIVRQRKWLNLMLDQIPLDELEQFCTSHHFTDWLPFRWRGLKQMTRYTYLIDYSAATEETLWAGLNRNRKRMINRAVSNNLKPQITDDLRAFYHLIELTYQRQGLVFRFSYDDFKLLDDEIVKRDQRRIITVFDHDGHPHAAIYLVYNQKSAYALLSAGDPQYRQLGGHTQVLWEAIKYFRNRVSGFNFGGSDIQRIEKHLMGFGGKLTPYFHIFQERPQIQVVEKIIEKEIIREVPVPAPAPPDSDYWYDHLLQIRRHGLALARKLLRKFQRRPEKPVTFSIITPCHNHGKYIEEMMDSVLKQTFPDFELIIVNDGSTDDTPKILDRIRNKKVKIIHTFHQGVAHARNCAIRQAKGQYILNLDADDKIAPQMLQKCLQVFESHPNAGIVYSDVEFFGAKSGLYDLPDFSMETMLRANCIVSLACFRKSDWERTEGYSSALTTGYEDFDLWLSILELGREVYKIDQTLTFYRTFSDPGVSRSEKRKQYPLKVLEARIQAFRRHQNFYQQYPSVYDEFCELEKHYEHQIQMQFNDPDRPVFSIITPTRNRPKMLMRAIESVQKQSFSNYEHIIVDDDGDEETGQLISTLNDHRIRYFRHDQSKGAAGAYNTGLRSARGQFINFLDDDDEYLPGILEKQFAGFNETTGNTGFIWTGITRVRDTEAGEETIVSRVWPALFDSHEQGLMVSTAIGNGFGLSVKKECIDKIGYYDESLPVGEDTDFMIRLSKEFNFRTVPEILVKIHHHGDTQLTHKRFISMKKESYGRIISRHMDYLVHHWDSYYMHNRVYSGLCYQTGDKMAGRRALWNMIKKFPTARIGWLDLFCQEINGTDYEECSFKKRMASFKKQGPSSLQE